MLIDFLKLGESGGMLPQKILYCMEGLLSIHMQSAKMSTKLQDKSSEGSAYKPNPKRIPKKDDERRPTERRGRRKEGG